MKIRIAGAQTPVTNCITANLAALHRAMDFAVMEKADVLLTPEGSLSGYRPDFDPAEAKAALEEVTTRARSAGLALALGTCFVEPGDGLCYDQVRFYDADGTYCGFHSKILLCGTMTETPQGEINDYATTPLQTFRLKDIPVGGLICNDLWANPGCTPMPDSHMTQQLSDMGARIIFHAVNGGRGRGPLRDLAWQYHESNLRMRAIAGKLWIVTVDSCHPTHLRCSCPSGVLNPQGDWVAKAAPQGEQFFAHTIGIDE